MRGLVDEVVITLHGDPDMWSLVAEWHGSRVGYACCLADARQLQLRDIRVENRCMRAWPYLNGLLHAIGLSRKPVDFRGEGLGSRLLERVVVEARARGMHEVCGYVTTSDLEVTPGLLDWYRRHGFEILEPAGGERVPVAKRIRRVLT